MVFTSDHPTIESTLYTSGGTLLQDNRHIIGRPEVSTRSAIKNCTPVLTKNWSHTAAQERSWRLVDFSTNLIVSDSDKIIEEENELDAELSMLLFDKLSICNLYLFACRDRKEPALDEG